MTTTSLNKAAVFAIASDLYDIQNHLRITHDMVLDQLCEGTQTDPASMEKMHERLFLLVGSIPVKLLEMEQLTDRLHKLGFVGEAVSA